jgi:hypothetical protein
MGLDTSYDNIGEVLSLLQRYKQKIIVHNGGVYRGFELRSGQTKDYKIGICCLSAKHAALRRKRKDCLARNQDSVSEWGDMSIPGLLFQ